MARLHKTVMARKLKRPVSPSYSESEGSDAEMEDCEGVTEEDEEMELATFRRPGPIGKRVVCSILHFPSVFFFVNFALQNDLYAAVRAAPDCAAPSFYNAVLPDAPNPCMHISGSGLTPLPLTVKDAQGIISAANAVQADAQDVTHAGGYWEISRDGVLFGNPKFEAYLESKVLPPLATHLGLDWGAEATPNLEFEKLVLCESDFRYALLLCIRIDTSFNVLISAVSSRAPLSRISFTGNCWLSSHPTTRVVMPRSSIKQNHENPKWSKSPHTHFIQPPSSRGAPVALLHDLNSSLSPQGFA